jgi:hypothetical protein
VKRSLVALVALFALQISAKTAWGFCRSSNLIGSEEIFWEPFPAGEIPVYFHPDLDDIGAAPLPLVAVVDQLKVAIRLWNEQAPSSVRFRLIGPTTEDSIPGAVVVRREPTDEDGEPACGATFHLACTAPVDVTGDHIRVATQGVVVHLNPDVAWSLNPGYDEDLFLAELIAHELGHVLTIGHPFDCGAEPWPLSTMIGGNPGKPAGIHRDDVNALRAVYSTAGFVLEDMRYSSTGEVGTWEREIEALDAPALPLTVSNSTPTLATWEDRRVLAYASIFPAGDTVAVKPGRGDSWEAFHFVTTDDIGVTHAPVGVSVVDDDVIVAWLHEPQTGTQPLNSIAIPSQSYIAVSRDFGTTFSAPIQLTVDISGTVIGFRSYGTSGYSIEYVESVDSWYVLATDEAGIVTTWQVPRSAGVPFDGQSLNVASQQRPTMVCGREGRRLDPTPGFPFDLECMIGLGGASPLQALRYIPALVIPAGGADILAGPATVETNLRIELSTSFLWRREAVGEPLWFGQTYGGHSNVVMFNRTTETEGVAPWIGSSIVPIAITGPPRPLTAPSMGLTDFGTDDVLQFVVGELFP